MNIEIQRAVTDENIPTLDLITQWALATCQATPVPIDASRAHITLRIVNKDESAALNQQFRNKSGPTNVLSFPDEPIPGFDPESLGDLIICAPLVTEEALKQGKTPQAHWAHLVVHGILHLLGYDHVEEKDAQTMEPLEIKILAYLGYPNPYE